ncbi:hypothetical protein [Niastella sp. OAS944]|uniref:hypothetical protein n=1 Tax=Niastella sp. OAS944 TaxID=2664089 RepID=UPI00349952AD|nr:hypothetical protein [Chitinophagaceae bacterium OAS944]
MANIQIQPDCGNAPRKLFLKELLVAIAEGNVKHIQELVPEQISWDIVGQKQTTGLDQYLKELKGHALWKAKELVVDTIITHGPDASVSGQITAADKITYKFCDVYRFKSAAGATINSITTFLIRL